MVRDGMSRKSSKAGITKAQIKAKLGDTEDLDKIKWEWKYTNEKIITITKAKSLKSFIENQNCKWVAYVVRGFNENITKQLMFPDERNVRRGHPHETVLQKEFQNNELGKSAKTFLRKCLNRKFYCK